MAGEISKSFHFLQADNVMQVVVRKSGDVTEIWRRADADSKWNEGEVLPDSFFAVFAQLSSFSRDSSL